VSPQRFTQVVLLTLWGGGLASAMLALLGVPGPPPLDAGLLAYVSGLLAGYLAAVMLLLMARTPVLERRVGPDVLARWHATGGRLFLTLVLVHAGAAVASWAAARGQDLLTATTSVLGLPWLGAATAGTALFLAIVAVSLGGLRRRLSYELWHGLHLLTYVAIGLSFVHELAGPNLAGQPVVQMSWTLLHAYALTLVVRFRAIAPLANMWRHRLRVVAMVPEADGVVSVVMQGRHVAELAAQPGQFFRWRFLTAATWRSAHPFSLSAAPRGDLLRIMRLVPDVADRDVYLCAAPGLSRAVRTALRDVGLPRKRLHEEAFSF
jgi:predicted ferric reductase